MIINSSPNAATKLSLPALVANYLHSRVSSQPRSQTLLAMFPKVDTRDAQAVARRIRELLRQIDPEGDFTFFNALFEEVGTMFRGDFGDFQPIDLAYHDYQHTLQATLCLAELMLGRHLARAQPEYTWRHVELGLAAILLHDSGYLKTRSDGEGTGAKYTYTHVLRSEAVAASHLPRFGLKPEDVEIVLGAIRCTGPTATVAEQNYSNESDLLLGCCVATADYLSQMAASDYPDELEILYSEFEESDDYQGIPRSERVFKSAQDLIEKTPCFWRKVVLAKLEHDFRGVYHFLSAADPAGANPYLDAVERNIKIISERAKQSSHSTLSS